jgi:hypothetical protein
MKKKFVSAGGEYMDITEFNKNVTGENYTKYNFIVCTIYLVMLG